LFELLINALQAAPGAESVLVEVTESQTQILIAVHDDGDGFSHLPLPATTLFWTSKNQGLGLGLALARRAVTAAGGMLAVSRSARLKGSVVTTVWNKT
jgi:C4-dicarboxylate-specific signal transduction histidine kinase